MRELPERLRIEYLYLDDETCKRCGDTEGNLEEAVRLLRPVLDVLGLGTELVKVHVDMVELAEWYRLEASPTIRANGIDVLGDVRENRCSDCSSMSGVETTCRTFLWKGRGYDVPPVAMIADGILSALYAGGSRHGGQYRMPENIVRFFEGRGYGKDGSSGGSAKL